MSVLNRTYRCDCGEKKDLRRQWCQACYDLLSDLERDEYSHKLSELRFIVGVLAENILERRNKVTGYRKKIMTGVET